jgi:hypothetical protein
MVKCTNYEAPRCVIVSIVLLLLLSYVQMFSSVPRFRTHNNLSLLRVFKISETILRFSVVSVFNTVTASRNIGFRSV